jgi:hypothetical protein
LGSADLIRIRDTSPLIDCIFAEAFSLGGTTIVSTLYELTFILPDAAILGPFGIVPFTVQLTSPNLSAILLPPWNIWIIQNKKINILFKMKPYIIVLTPWIYTYHAFEFELSIAIINFKFWVRPYKELSSTNLFLPAIIDQPLAILSSYH